MNTKNSEGLTRRSFFGKVGVAGAAWGLSRVVGALSGLVLLLGAAIPAIGAAPVALESSGLKVAFCPSFLVPISIVNKHTGERLELKPGSSFRLVFDILDKDFLKQKDPFAQARHVVLEGGDCQDRKARTENINGEWHYTILYKTPYGPVEVQYILPQTRSFLLKQLRFTPAFENSYLVRDLTLQRIQFAQKPGGYVPFRHGGSLAHFLRADQGSWLLGLELPFLERDHLWVKTLKPEEENHKLDIGGVSDLRYDIARRYLAGEAFLSEKMYLVACKRRGQLCPTVPTVVAACVQSGTAPDIGESEAMVRLVEYQTTPAPDAVIITLNGWSSGITIAGGELNSERVRNKLLYTKTVLGDYVFECGRTWAGTANLMAKLDFSATETPYPDWQREFLSFCKKAGIGVSGWCSLQNPDPWAGNDLFAIDPRWHHPMVHEGRRKGRHGQNLADRRYRDWILSLIKNDIARKGFAFWGADEYHSQTCGSTSPELDYAPGKDRYASFHARRWVFEKVREQFGPKLVIGAARPQMDMGVWDGLYLDAMFTVSEYNNRGASDGDRMRYWGRMRHYYHFVPSYRDFIIMDLDNTVDNVDYQILSALAVANHYLGYLKGTLPAERGSRVRYWLDWARGHGDLMRASTKFLPDWSGKDACDGYLRLAGNQGYAFVFNANDRPLEFAIRTDQLGEEYAGTVFSSVQKEFVSGKKAPEGEAGKPDMPLRMTGGEIRMTMPPKSACLLNIILKLHS